MRDPQYPILAILFLLAIIGLSYVIFTCFIDSKIIGHIIFFGVWSGLPIMYIHDKIYDKKHGL